LLISRTAHAWTRCSANLSGTPCAGQRHLSEVGRRTLWDFDNEYIQTQTCPETQKGAEAEETATGFILDLEAPAHP
jgi:hypothetical protein